MFLVLLKNLLKVRIIFCNLSTDFSVLTSFKMSDEMDSVAVAMNGVSNGEFDTNEQINEEVGDLNQQNYGDLDDPGVKFSP